MRQGIREVKETAILRKVLFSILEFLGSSLVRPWFVLGLLHETKREDTREGNLKNWTFYRRKVMRLEARNSSRAAV